MAAPAMKRTAEAVPSERDRNSRMSTIGCQSPGREAHAMKAPSSAIPHWSELVQVGFVGLTMESVAARARTGVAVLYRRWPNKDQLVLAAIAHYRHARPVETPDTGTLRGVLLALLTAFSKARATFVAVAATAAFSGLLANTGVAPAQVRDEILGERLQRNDLIVYQRAQERGEIDLERVPPAVLTMPFDLARHDLLMSLKPLKPARIRSIIDELFLPLVQPHQYEQGGTGT
jgi:AcrR family transcriptional regulator